MQANYFDPNPAAQRYARGRPYFHPVVVERLRAYLALSAPLARALDVACGTGLSTISLLPIARSIIGVDLSSSMLELAPRQPGIDYAVSAAERLPFREATFDLLTISSAFHWLERSAFLSEASRVLEADGLLVIYDNYFSGQMEGRPEVKTWYRDIYSSRYPGPPRNNTPFGLEDARQAGFMLRHEERYENNVRFTLEMLIDYLVTQSNIIAAVEKGSQQIDDLRRWLFENLRPYFGNGQGANFLF